MIGVVMPETCWAVSVRQSNKFYDWLLYLVGCFYLSNCGFWKNWYSESYTYWGTKNICALSFLIIKPMRCTDFLNLFWNRTLHVSDRFTVHHQESSTVNTAIGICHTCYADCLLARSGSILISLASSQHSLYDIYLLLCIRGLSGKYPAILNISRTGHVAVM